MLLLRYPCSHLSGAARDLKGLGVSFFGKLHNVSQ